MFKIISEVEESKAVIEVEELQDIHAHVNAIATALRHETFSHETILKGMEEYLREHRGSVEEAAEATRAAEENIDAGCSNDTDGEGDCPLCHQNELGCIQGYPPNPEDQVETLLSGDWIADEFYMTEGLQLMFRLSGHKDCEIKSSRLNDYIGKPLNVTIKN